MTATARAMPLEQLVVELEALTPQVSAAVSAKDYERFNALQAQQEKLMSRLLASLTQETLSGLEEAQRDRLRELVRRREEIQADLVQWSEALRSELVLINQSSRVLKHYR